MNNMKHKILMTLALLLTAVTGAWATTDPNSVSWNYQTWKGWADSETTHTVGDITITCSGNAKAYQSTSSNNPLALQAGANDAITFTSNGKPFASVAIMTDDELNVAGWTYNSSKWSYEWSGEPTTSVTLSGCNINADVIIFTFGTAEAPLTVAWTASTKTGTFEMPGSDVVLTPIYAKAAAFATTGAEPDVKTQLPEAAEGVIAGTDASLIAEGTGIVAFAGTSNEVKQGTLMYAVGTSATEAPDAFSPTVPTAKTVADDGADVYVWYYIKGADTPDGQQANEENTFNDTEPACLTVTVLTNKFDIQFNAANANTIEAGKATVTVGGTAATVTEGKLEGVKMGSEVKMTAKDGYKFRKVEVKKSDGSKRLDESTVGMIVCTNGKAYPVNMKDNLPSGVTAVGIVAYKNGKNGLVMALTDEATNMNWDTATGNNGAKAHTPAVEGYSWKVPTIGEWQYNIFTGAGVGNLAGLSTYMTAAGGTGLQDGCYWTSTPKNNGYYARCIKIENGSINFSPGGNIELKTNGYHVRAVFAF